MTGYEFGDLVLVPFPFTDQSATKGPSLARLGETWYRHPMIQLAKKLDKKLASWRPEVAAQVEQIITDVIELADTDTLDLQPSRAVVQEVLDTLDERQAG